MRRHLARASVVVAALVAVAGEAEANWTLNIGYHNPAVSTYGLNFLYIGSQWGFEAGIGWVDVNSSHDFDKDDKDDKDDEKTDQADAEKKDDEDDDTTRVNIAGDVDIRYFLASGKFRPYIQGGFGVGIGAAVGDHGGAGAGTGGGFAGIGLLIGSPSFYAYGSYNVNGSENTFVQAGLGFDI